MILKIGVLKKYFSLSIQIQNSRRSQNLLVDLQTCQLQMLLLSTGI